MHHPACQILVMCRTFSPFGIARRAAARRLGGRKNRLVGVCHESGVGAVNFAALDGGEQHFLLRANHLAGGLRWRPSTRFSNHPKLHWNYLHLIKVTKLPVSRVSSSFEQSALP